MDYGSTGMCWQHNGSAWETSGPRTQSRPLAVHQNAGVGRPHDGGVLAGHSSDGLALQRHLRQARL